MHMRVGLLLVGLLLLPMTAWGASAVITWGDNSANELGFEVERMAGQCTAPDAFSKLGTVGTDIKTYQDNTVTVGVRYCYRIRAYNNQFLDGSGATQYSAYSNEADFGIPLAAPAAPSQNTAAPGP